MSKTISISHETAKVKKSSFEVSPVMFRILTETDSKEDHKPIHGNYPNALKRDLTVYSNWIFSD
jgi:hypothetical protein